MATRSTIKIVKKDETTARMYHHWDGYPEGVGAELENALVGYYNDTEHDGPKTPYELAKTINNVDATYEFTTDQHGDEAYAYLIDLDKHTIKCYEVGWDEFEWKEEKVVYEHEF